MSSYSEWKRQTAIFHFLTVVFPFSAVPEFKFMSFDIELGKIYFLAACKLYG